MAHRADEPLPIPNSEQEYFRGVADDGGDLNIISQHVTPPWEQGEARPPIGPHAANAEHKHDSRFHIEAEKKILDADRAHMERVRECVELLQDTVRLGKPAREILAIEAEIELEFKRRRLERLKNTPVDQLVEGEEEANHRPGRKARQDTDDTPFEGEPAEVGAPGAKHETKRSRQAGRMPAPRAPREPGVRNVKFSAALLLTLALRAAKDLPALSEKLRDLEAKLRPAEAELKLKQEFYLDKGVAIVTDTLSSMDAAYGPLGFGNWMPFRFVDQWLMFCGVLNRVLAAHGLMPSGHAAAYRKLLDTPSISLRSADAGPPKSWGLAYRVRELPTMKALLDRIAEVQSGRGPPL